MHVLIHTLKLTLRVQLVRAKMEDKAPQASQPRFVRRKYRSLSLIVREGFWGLLDFIISFDKEPPK